MVADKQPPAALVTAHRRVGACETLQQHAVRYPAIGKKSGAKQLHAPLVQGFGDAVNIAIVLNELGIRGVGGEPENLLRGGQRSIRPRLKGDNPTATVL